MSDIANPPPVRTGRAFTLLATMQVVLVATITVVSLALPAIQRELHLTHSELALVSSAYGMSFSGLLLLGGRLADLLGPRRMFLTGAAVFGLASAAAVLAPNLPVLLGARLGQGIGAALAAPAAMALLNQVFPDSAARARAIGLWGGLSASGAVAGTLISGVVVTWVSWRWAFLVAVLVAALTVAAAPAVLPARPRRPTARARIDLTGALLVTAGLCAVSYGLLRAAEHPWSSADVHTPLVAGMTLLVAFLVVEARSDAPLMPLTFFASAHRSVALIMLLVTSAGFATNVFFLSLYFQQVRAWTPLAATAALLPTMLVVVGSALAGRLIVRTGAWAIATVGLAVAAAGLLVLGRIKTATPYGGLLVGLALFPFGAGVAFSGATVATVGDVPDGQAGLAGGIANTAVEVGPTVGFATLVSIATAHGARLAAGGADPATAATAGYALGLTIAGCAFVVLAVLAAALRRPAPRSRRPHTPPTRRPGSRPVPTRSVHLGGRS